MVSMFGSLGVLFALMWKARSTPLNYYLLALFTLLESHMVGTIGKRNIHLMNALFILSLTLYILVTFYDKGVVIQALLITCGVFFILTLFTLQSKWDFSGMGPM